MNKEDIVKALQELRKSEEKRKFEQSVDLIVNLKDFDVKKESVNLFLSLPHKIKDVKLCAFLNKKSDVIESVVKRDFGEYKNKNKLRKLVKSYDFFVSLAELMPLVATTFGRALGPAGKMPSPQIGIIKKEDEREIKELLEKFQKIVKVKSKEPSLKLCIGKENMKDEEIADNIIAAYNAILNALPNKKENLKSVMIKFTMTKPIKISFGG